MIYYDLYWYRLVPVAMLMCNIVKNYRVSYVHDYARVIPHLYPSKFTPKFMEIYK